MISGGGGLATVLRCVIEVEKKERKLHEKGHSCEHHVMAATVMTVLRRADAKDSTRSTCAPMNGHVQ